MPRTPEHGSNEHFEEKAQGFLGLRGKATYEPAEFLSYSWILSYSGVFRRCGSRLYRLTLLYMVLKGICRNDAVLLMSPPYCSSASAISFFSKQLF